jgi:hypothetical protein
MFFRERLERGGAPRAAVHADLAIPNIVDSVFLLQRVPVRVITCRCLDG